MASMILIISLSLPQAGTIRISKIIPQHVSRHDFLSRNRYSARNHCRYCTAVKPVNYRFSELFSRFRWFAFAAFAADYFVDYAVLQRFVGAHPVVALHVSFDFVKFLASVASYDFR